MSSFTNVVGTTATVLSGVELLTQSIYPEQKGIISNIFKDETQQKTAKGALAGISLLYLLSQAIVAKNLNDNKA